MLTAFFDRITKLSIRFRWLVIATTAIAMILGVFALQNLNLELLPKIEFPQTVVVAQWSDSESADQLLNEVTIPLEERLSEIDGVVNVESTTSKAFAFIVVRNEFGLDQDRVLADIEGAVTGTALPEGVEEPQVLNFSLSDLPVVVVSASSAGLTLPELKDLVTADLQPKLEGLEDVSRVNVSGGQELPGETVVEGAADTGTGSAEQPTPKATGESGATAAMTGEAVSEATVEPTLEPGQLPAMLVQAAQSQGITINNIRDITPEMMAGFGATGEQVLTVLGLIPPDTWRYAMPETLALLPKEFTSTLDPELRQELDELASDYGGVGAYSADEVAALLADERTGTSPADGTEPAAGSGSSGQESQRVEPVALPESWIAAADQAGQKLESTADVTPEAMAAIAEMAPQLLADLTPEMWRAIDPAAVALALPTVQDSLDEGLLRELQAIRAATQGDQPAPMPLPQSWQEAATAAGATLETTADLNPQAIELLAGSAPELLADLDEETILAFAPKLQAALPAEYVATLDEGLQQTLAVIGALSAGAGGTGVEAPPVAAVDLPDSWQQAGTQAGQQLETTADVSAEVMGGIVNFAPALLGDLESEMWRALDPEAIAVALPVAEEDLDPQLVLELRAIQSAGEGQAPEPVKLPESWVKVAASAGLTIATTDDITPEEMGLLAGNAPQLLADLSTEQILAFSPEVQAALPEGAVSELDPGVQETLRVIAARRAAFELASGGGEAAPETTPEAAPTADPARLPDVLIQGAQNFGVDIEYAHDITPEFMRQITAIGPQGLQVLGLLTPGNLRALQPEVIALLPAAFVDDLDSELRAELDAIAAEYGGAGQLALAEAEAAAEASAEAPPLSGIWIEPAPTGEPSQFQTAADILNNGFVPSAAQFLNFLIDSPQIQDPVMWISALTPDVVQYLAENEEGFVSGLSPAVLEMMSPEMLTFLLDSYPEAFDNVTTARLQALASGEATAFVPEASITRTNGNPSLILNVYKAGDSNTVVVAHRVFDELEAYSEEHPDVSFDLAFEQASFIEDAVSGVAREGLLGAVFAIVVILIFLSGRVGGKYKLSWRATAVVGISIPLSILIALLLMRWVPPTIGAWMHDLADSTGNGFIAFIAQLFPSSVTLNIMTLSGLTVAVGRVVDDSIVVLENSYRYIQISEDRFQAITQATKEVAIAIFASTATTVAVFLPLGLLGGIIGSFFLPFGLTVTYALAASFVVAITVVPALVFILIFREHIPEEKETWMQRTYTPPLQWALGHRGATLAIAAVIFLFSLFLLRELPRSFIPSLGEPTVNVSVELPSGTPMQETDALAGEFETTLADLPGLDTVQSEVGGAGGIQAFFGGGNVSQNQANMTISIADQEQLTNLTEQVRQRAEETFGRDNVVVSAASQTGFSGFSLIVAGSSMEELTPVADDIKNAIASVDIDGDGRPDIVNVTSSIDNAGTDGNGTVIRIDGRPAISFGGEMETENTLGVTSAAKEVVSQLESLPPGAEVTEGFESEQQVQGFQDMVRAIMYSIVIVYIIMALSFRSLIHPFTILFTLPFALVGASLALFITNSVLGISAMIGLMMLVGIVVTNAIVLLELVQQLRQRGRNAHDALVEGGRTRLRPIWMTALAASLALLPLALSQEAGAIIASELATVVIGGLLFATVLTLVVVPVVYSLFDAAGARIRRRVS